MTIADYTPNHNFMHGGLTYNPSNGLLYAVTGSVCDISPWYGRIVAIATTGPSVAGSFFTMSGRSVEGASGGGIWGPGGASIDPSTNDVFVATGNADTSKGTAQNAGYAEQVIELSLMLTQSLPATIRRTFQTFTVLKISISVRRRYSSHRTVVRRWSQRRTNPECLSFTIKDRSAPARFNILRCPSRRTRQISSAYRPSIRIPATFTLGCRRRKASISRGWRPSASSQLTLNPTPVWSANFGPDGERLPGGQTQRSPLSIANGVVYVANYSLKTEFAFDAATGAKLWSVTLSDRGEVGTVIANGIVYVSSRDGNITAWAPPGSRAKKKK